MNEQPKKISKPIVASMVTLVVIIGLGLTCWLYRYYQPNASADTIIVSKSDRDYIYKNGSLKPLTPEGFKVLSNGPYREATSFVLMQKDNALAIYDIPHNQTKPLGITLTNSGNIEERANLDYVGSNRDEFLINVATYDKSSKEYQHHTDFGGDSPIAIKTQEYRYTFSTNQLVKSTIYQTARSLMEKDGESFGEFAGPSIVYWDNENNVMYGYESGEGVGRAAPIFKIDLTAQTVTKTNQDITKKITQPFFSPKLDKFVLITTTDKIVTAQLYSTNDFQNPIKTYDLSNMGAPNSFNWSEDGKTAIVTVDKDFYVLDVETGKSRLVHSDTTLESSYTPFDPNSPAVILPSGKVFVYVDWTNTHQEDKSTLFNKDNNRYNLVSVDMANGKTTTLIESSDFIDLAGLAITK
jgi:hypothetical protein